MSHAANRRDEDVAHVFLLACEWISKLEMVLDQVQLEQLRARLKREAAAVGGGDESSIALRCLATACEAYLMDPEND